MKFKIAMTVLSIALATAAHSGKSVAYKEFGHWVAEKRADDFNPNTTHCHVINVSWYPETENSPKIDIDALVRLYVDRKAITDDGFINEGIVASFYDWDYAAERWTYSSDLYDDGTSVNGKPNNVVGKVDGKFINFTSPNLPEELKGKFELTYRYTAFYLPNSPVQTYTISLIGFTQAWNYARELCNG